MKCLKYYSGKRTYAIYFSFASMTLGILSTSVYSADLWFPPSLISDEVKTVADLSQFEQGGQMPGRYDVEIWLNENLISTRKIPFITHTDDKQLDSTGLMACLKLDDLPDFGVRPAVIEALPPRNDEDCLSLGELIPQATNRFDFQKMRLNISIPQAYLQARPKGWIPPEQWDEGINAAILNYSFNGSDNRGQYGNSRNHYLRLNSGLNVGPWRLRDDRNWTGYDSDQYRYQKWQHASTYVERAIIPLRSRLTMGDTTTDGDIFDSLGYRGVRLMTDDSMYPDSQRGYAPVIRGSASTNSQVSVRQNGYLVYQVNVAPGEFVIDDLYPMYSSGDLEVTVTEASGIHQVFTVPYSSVPVLLREGRMNYGITVGRLRNNSNRSKEPTFAQSTLVVGLPHGLTAYGGMQFADNYRAGTLGTGFNMGKLGALSADITHADSRLADGSRHKGQSLRFLYGRSLNDLGTTFQLTGYRYSTQGFHTLSESALKDMSGWLSDVDIIDIDGRPARRPATDYFNLYDSKRQQLQVNISQRIGDSSSLYLTASRQTYWNKKDNSESLQAGFSSSLGSVNYSLSLSQTRTSNLPATDRSLFLSLSVPLDHWLPTGAPPVYATLSSSRDNKGSLTQQVGLTGSLLEQHNLSWSVNQGYSQQGGNNGSTSLSYQGRYGNVNMGYSQSSGNYQQTSYGVSGGALLHRNGFTLSQPLGETSVLVAIPGASGVPVGNGGGIKTDWRGYTAMPYATNYRENRIALDTSQLDERTEIDNAVSRVVPTRGAVVKADFKARTGLRALLTLTRDAKPLPFGATVMAGDNSGIIGDDGEVFLSGLSPEGVLKVKWGREADEQCIAKYNLSGKNMKGSLIRSEYECR
ncbi:Outer membrane usher protein fimD precursor [Serratia fonticola]|uniref:fimbria/pilus outer membrane usher protein n=1 Tax=Serratia fonticola TaxID=47917 RepID=UPI002182866F|nr:fimbria/pilus outer membrane usher protein [Serratia fonticola]CAI2158509.1 Outer membrane usher protein fimD precursor [Serratia fonticola]